MVAGCGGRSVQLTNREWEVLVLLGQGRTTREIANRLVVSTGTIRSHVAALLRKLGVGDRRTLAATIGIATDVVSPACRRSPGHDGAMTAAIAASTAASASRWGAWPTAGSTSRSNGPRTPAAMRSSWRVVP